MAQALVAAGPKVDGHGVEGGLRGGGEHRGHLAGWAVGAKALEQIQGVGGGPAAGDGPQQRQPEARTMDTATSSPTKVGSSLREVRNPSLAPERKVSNTGTPLT